MLTSEIDRLWPWIVSAERSFRVFLVFLCSLAPHGRAGLNAVKIGAGNPLRAEIQLKDLKRSQSTFIDTCPKKLKRLKKTLSTFIDTWSDFDNMGHQPIDCDILDE